MVAFECRERPSMSLSLERAISVGADYLETIPTPVVVRGCFGPVQITSWAVMRPKYPRCGSNTHGVGAYTHPMRNLPARWLRLHTATSLVY